MASFSMVYARELQSIVEAAERAAAASDFPSAERLLRQAVGVQEAQLGPRHPDLANTLNNLGIVCERTGKLDDAEACYRKAYSIATAALGPGHALTVTSGENLREFCEARGKPFEPPVSESALVDFGPEAVAPQQNSVPRIDNAPPTDVTPRHEVASTTKRESAPVIRSEGPRRGIAGIVIGIVVVGALGFAGYLVMRDAARPAVNEVAAPPVAATPPPAPAPPSEPEPAPAPPAATPSPSPVPPAAEAAATPAAPTTPQGDASVADAQLCREFSTRDWRCTPADNPASPGAFTYFTRVKSRTDTTVQHRWYFEGALLRTVSLRIGANEGAGFRTYSRNTVIAERAGSWRVELRGADGTLLHEVRFTVR